MYHCRCTGISRTAVPQSFANDSFFCDLSQELFKCIRRQRTGKIITLHQIAAGIPQKRELSLRLNALRDHLETKAACKIQNQLYKLLNQRGINISARETLTDTGSVK